MNNNIYERINALNKEIDEISTKLRKFEKALQIYKLGIRDINKDYPDWDSYLTSCYYMTPMAWITDTVRINRQKLANKKSEMRKLVSERTWYEVEYFRELDELDIQEIVDRDGFITGAKL